MLSTFSERIYFVMHSNTAIDVCCCCLVFLLCFELRSIVKLFPQAVDPERHGLVMSVCVCMCVNENTHTTHTCAYNNVRDRYVIIVDLCSECIYAFILIQQEYSDDTPFVLLLFALAMFFLCL